GPPPVDRRSGARTGARSAGARAAFPRPERRGRRGTARCQAARASAQEVRGQLLQPLVARGPRALQNPLHVAPQLRLPPIVAGRLLGTRRLARARGLEQRLGRRGVESRVVTRWEAIVPSGPRLTRILLHERPRHGRVSRGDETSCARSAGSRGRRACTAVWWP